MNQEQANCQKTNLTLRDSNPRLSADRRETDVADSGFEPGSIDFHPSARPLSQTCFGVRMFTIVGMPKVGCGAAYV
jgi:hypothetical protein